MSDEQQADADESQADADEDVPEDAIQDGDFVRLAYTLRTVDDDTVVDTTDQETAEEADIDTEEYDFEPRVITVGAGHVFESVDEELTGAEVGDTGTVEIAAAEAFGEYEDEQVRTVSANKIDEDDRYPGAQVQIDGDQGQVITMVGGRARVDFNHPLAGEDLEYEYEVLELVDDREEQAASMLEMYLQETPEVWIETDTVEEEQVVESDEDEGEDEDEPSEPETETVEVEIPRSMLPPEYDNRRNTVVNFDDRLRTGEIVSEGTLGLTAAGVGSSDDDAFAIDKGEGNTYESSLTLLGAANANATSQEIEQNSPGDPIVGWNNSTVTLGDGSTVELTHEQPVYEQQQRWNNWTEEVPTNETLEIVFVMDESGSMDDGSKMENAQEAAHEFVEVVETTTNSTEPRYSVVGYTSTSGCSYWYDEFHQGRNRNVCEANGPADVTQHQPLNTDEEGAHDAIDGLEAQGNTPISQSIEEASDVLQTEGNSSNEQFIVLLTDGQHNVDDDTNADVRWPDEAATQEVPDGVTLHSVGFGNPDDMILEATADATTDGEYYPVSDSGDLSETFEEIAENVSTRTVHHNESYNETVLVGVPTHTMT